jgi:hypothetical protein
VESEKITGQEIEKARTLCLEFIEAKERMAEAVVELSRKFCSGPGLDLTLSADWLKFYQVVEFMLEKDALLEKRLEEARQAMSAQAESTDSFASLN